MNADLSSNGGTVIIPGSLRLLPWPEEWLVNQGLSPLSTTDCSGCVANCPGITRVSVWKHEKFGVHDEGATFHQEDVREVPDHPAARSRLGDLPQPPTQAAAGLT